MEPVFRVPPCGRAARFADKLAAHLMPLVTPRGESPQRTHRWNNIRTSRSAANHLDRSLMITCAGDRRAVRRLGAWDIRFHLGGWSHYVVLAPVHPRDDGWYVGWVTPHGAGASQIPVMGYVRMLLGPYATEFFGVTRTENTQIKLREIGRGRLGDNGSFRMLPLH